MLVCFLLNFPFDVFLNILIVNLVLLYGQFFRIIVFIYKIFFSFQGVKLRFVVIDRLGSDLEKHFKSGEAPFPLTTVLRVAVEVMEALEFMHAKHYVHNDIKAQNLMTGFTTDTADRIFLLDFGLASKYR